MRQMTWVVALIITLLAIMAAPIQAAPLSQASTATPTPTAAASYYSTTTLSSGNTLLVERRVSFGDLFTGFAALLVAGVVVATTLPDIALRLFKR